MKARLVALAVVALMAGAVVVGVQFGRVGTVPTQAQTSTTFQAQTNSQTSTTLQTKTVSQIQAPTGFSFSPRTLQGADITDFFTKANQAGGFVSWSGDWDQLSNPNAAPAVVSTLARSNNLTTVIEVQFFSQADGKLLKPLDNQTEQSYIQSAVSFVQRFKTAYLGIGIEVNVLYEKSPSDFASFVSLFPKVYDAVKAASPATKVFTVFQLEKMKGMNGGLFGGTNDASKSEWSLVGMFNRSDLVAFTTYPGLVYSSPSNLPQGYYSEVALHVSKPIAFTEVGWQSNSTIAGWEGSEQAQADFVADFFRMTATLHQSFSIWSFMYDQNVAEPFTTMGLYYSSGVAKQAWSKWSAGG